MPIDPVGVLATWARIRSSSRLGIRARAETNESSEQRGRPGRVPLSRQDDPRVSNFFHYFSYNFERLGLKKLITACYRNQDPDLFSRSDSERAIWLEYNGNTKVGRVPDVEDMATCLRFHNFPGRRPCS